MPKAQKTWAEKFANPAAPEVKPLPKAHGGQPAGSLILIPTPQLIEDYVRQLPQGCQVEVGTLRCDLAAAQGADFSCPMTTGIFLRIVAEKAWEELQHGKPLPEVAPFWRVLNASSPLGQKLACGVDFIER